MLQGTVRRTGFNQRAGGSITYGRQKVCGLSEQIPGGKRPGVQAENKQTDRAGTTGMDEQTEKLPGVFEEPHTQRYREQEERRECWKQ